MIDEYNMEVEIYNLTVKRYNAEKEDYIQSMNRWLDEVFRYAKCKVDDLTEPWLREALSSNFFELRSIFVIKRFLQLAMMWRKTEVK